MNASLGWQAINVPGRAFRASQAADIHPGGQPALQPRSLPAAGTWRRASVRRASLRVDPQGRGFTSRGASRTYAEKRLGISREALGASWVPIARRCRKLVTYHSEFDYMLRQVRHRARRPRSNPSRACRPARRTWRASSSSMQQEERHSHPHGQRGRPASRSNEVARKTGARGVRVADDGRMARKRREYSWIGLHGRHPFRNWRRLSASSMPSTDG